MPAGSLFAKPATQKEVVPLLPPPFPPPYFLSSSSNFLLPFLLPPPAFPSSAQYTVVIQCLGVLAKAQAVEMVMRWCSSNDPALLGRLSVIGSWSSAAQSLCSASSLSRLFSFPPHPAPGPPTFLRSPHHSSLLPHPHSILAHLLCPPPPFCLIFRARRVVCVRAGVHARCKAEAGRAEDAPLHDRGLPEKGGNQSVERCGGMWRAWRASLFPELGTHHSWKPEPSTLNPAALCPQLSDACKVLEACERMCKSTSWRRLLHQLLLAGNSINMHRPGSRPMQAFRLNSLTKFADMR